MMIHEKLHLRVMLKGFLNIMNDIPYHQRDNDIKGLRVMIQKIYDRISKEAFMSLKKIDPTIPDESI